MYYSVEPCCFRVFPFSLHTSNTTALSRHLPHTSSHSGIRNGLSSRRGDCLIEGNYTLSHWVIDVIDPELERTKASTTFMTVAVSPRRVGCRLA